MYCGHFSPVRAEFQPNQTAGVTLSHPKAIGKTDMTRRMIKLKYLTFP